MAILEIRDLNYNATLGVFKTSVKHFINNWSNRKKEKNPFGDDLKDLVLYYAAYNGNRDVVKFMMEEYNANPNVTHLSEKAEFRYPLSRCIYNGIGTRGGGSFRDAAIYLLDHGAIPNANNNEALEACYSSSISMIVGINNFLPVRKKEDGHDRVVIRLLQEPSVAKTVFELQQKKFYFLFPEINDLFF